MQPMQLNNKLKVYSFIVCYRGGLEGEGTRADERAVLDGLQTTPVTKSKRALAAQKQQRIEERTHLFWKWLENGRRRRE